MGTHENYLLDCIERGADYLDREYPGWIFQINLEQLRLESCSQCVGGQIAGNFHTFLQELREGENLPLNGSVDSYGFDCTGNYRDFELLTDLWKAYISERRQDATRCGWEESVF